MELFRPIPASQFLVIEFYMMQCISLGSTHNHRSALNVYCYCSPCLWLQIKAFSHLFTPVQHKHEYSRGCLDKGCQQYCYSAVLPSLLEQRVNKVEQPCCQQKTLLLSLYMFYLVVSIMTNTDDLSMLNILCKRECTIQSAQQ